MLVERPLTIPHKSGRMGVTLGPIFMPNPCFNAMCLGFLARDLAPSATILDAETGPDETGMVTPPPGAKWNLLDALTCVMRLKLCQGKTATSLTKPN